MLFKLVENISIALLALSGNKVRSFLTTLGVIIGVFAVLELVAVGEGVKVEVTKQIESLGTNVVIVLPGKVSEGNYNFASTIGASTLTEADRATIGSLPSIEASAPLMLISSPVQVGQEVSSNFLVLGTTPEFFAVRSLSQDAGRFFSQDDANGKQRLAVLGYPVWQHFFGDETFAEKTIELRGKAFTVVGVLPKPKTRAALGGPSFDDVVYIPFETAKDITGTSQIFRILAKVTDSREVEDSTNEIKKAILANHGGSEDFTVLTQEDVLDLFSSVVRILTAMLGALGGIALLVGGIGIMNIMLVSVTERTREIGIRKAVGASTVDIFLQFLVESIVLSLAGGVLALVLALVGAQVVSSKTGFALVITSTTILLAIGFAMLVGVLFGVAPALRAARLDPVKALRYE